MKAYGTDTCFLVCLKFFLFFNGKFDVSNSEEKPFFALGGHLNC